MSVVISKERKRAERKLNRQNKNKKKGSNKKLEVYAKTTKKHFSQNRPILLDVEYSEKDEVKAMGARWNSEIKSWYVTVEFLSRNPNLMAALSKYLPKDFKLERNIDEEPSESAKRIKPHPRIITGPLYDPTLDDCSIPF
ncbi:MAG: hypothetical protein IBX56_20010 [Methylomicrobium sp.]|nr:hypothetical protein [Methylomicrobium sp.]